MRFLEPGFFHLAWLSVIPLLLWLFRRAAKRLPVSTLLFFKSLAKEHQESAWLRKIKKWLSLALTLLALFLGIFALARPAGTFSAETARAVVLVADRSASMAARDEAGKPRIDVAKDLLRSVVRSLPDQAVMTLIAFDTRAEVLLSRSRNRRECLRLIDSLEVSPVEGDLEGAMASARRLAELDAGAKIWLAGDAPPPEGSEAGFLDCGLTRVINAGITGFQLRPGPLSSGSLELFVKVEASAANAEKVTSTLEMSLAGKLAQLREIELAPGQGSTLILPLEAARGQRVEVRLRTPGDCLSWDDAAAAPLPRVRALSVAWFTEKADPFTEIAMASLVESRRIEMTRHEPKAWPLKEKPDVYVFEHWLPEKDWPQDRPVIALNPRRNGGPLVARLLPGNGIPHDGVRAVLPDHAVLFRVASARVAVTQSVSLTLPSSLETLWMAGNEPVLAAGEHAGQRLVVTAFSPSQSEQLALLPAFPLVLGNALYWCAEPGTALNELRVRHTGELLPARGLVSWHAWDGGAFTESSEESAHDLLPLRKIGAWETAEGQSGGCVLASAAETNVRAGGQTDTPVFERSVLPVNAFGTWAQRLLWVLLALLLLESFLFHRRAVY